MNNLQPVFSKSNQGVIRGHGMMMFWNTLSLIPYMTDEQAGRVIKKLIAVGMGKPENIQLDSQMEQDAFHSILDGSMSSDENWQRKSEKNRKAAFRRWQRDGGAKQIPSDPSAMQTHSERNPSAMQNKRTQQNSTQQNSTQQNLTQSDRQIKGGAHATFTSNSSSNQQPASHLQTSQQSNRENLQEMLSAKEEQLAITPADQPERIAELEREIRNLKTILATQQPDDSPF